MRKTLSFLVVLVIFLSACSPSEYRRSATATILAPLRTPQGTPESCLYFQQPTPNPKEPSLFAPLSTRDHVRGPVDAYLTVMAYSDFQCPACAKLAALMTRIQQKYPQDIRFVYRDFPLVTINDKAAISTQAAEAANLQGKFWEMHDLLFAKQAEWIKLDKATFQAWAADQAAGLGMDKARFVSDLTSAAIAAIPEKAWQDGLKIQLPGVPLILINGELLKVQGTLLNDLESIIRLDLLPKRQFKSCPPYVIEPSKQYSATLKTAKGDVVIRLFADKVPNTVNNFIVLARSGWYDNITFHRVSPGSIVQTGDPSGTGQGNPGYFIPDEIDPTLKFDRPWMVAMTNSGPNTNGSQFFITFVAAPKLDGTYTIFGQVVSGMEILQKLTARDPRPGENVPDGDLLITVLIEER